VMITRAWCSSPGIVPLAPAFRLTTRSSSRPSDRERVILGHLEIQAEFRRVRAFTLTADALRARGTGGSTSFALALYSNLSGAAALHRRHPPKGRTSSGPSVYAFRFGAVHAEATS
jgi:hypothetical protein